MEPLALMGLAGVYAYYRHRKKQRRLVDWRQAVEQAVAQLDGRASWSGSRPQILATISGLTVKTEIRSLASGNAQSVAMTELSVPEIATSKRLYVGLNTAGSPRDMRHVPQVDGLVTSGSKPVIVHASDEAAGRAFSRHALRELEIIGRTAGATAVEVRVTAGTLRLAVHGLRPSAALIERIMVTSVRLALGAANGGALPVIETGAGAHSACTLCKEKSGSRGDGPWVRCGRCASAYHARCYRMATGCVVQDCEETRQIPI